MLCDFIDVYHCDFGRENCLTELRGRWSLQSGGAKDKIAWQQCTRFILF